MEFKSQYHLAKADLRRLNTGLVEKVMADKKTEVTRRLMFHAADAIEVKVADEPLAFVYTAITHLYSDTEVGEMVGIMRELYFDALEGRASNLARISRLKDIIAPDPFTNPVRKG